MMNLGDFRRLTKDLPDEANFGLKLDSEIEGYDLVLAGFSLDQRGDGWIDIHVVDQDDGVDPDESLAD